MDKVKVEHIDYRVGKTQICTDMSLQIKKGCFYGIIGPNGSGKSTLLKQICRIYEPSGGAIYLNGKELHEFSYKETAKQLGVLLQENESTFDFTVTEMVMMGRTPYHRAFQADSAEDQRIVKECLKQVNMLEYAKRRFATLSGGEKQRALLARALAQKTDVLLLDEPTNNLDIGRQYQMFELLRSLPITIFMIIHDLNLAAQFCDKIAVIDNGRVARAGTPCEVLTTEMLAHIFSVRAEVSVAGSGKPYVRYLGPAESLA